MIYVDASFVCSLYMREIHTPAALQLIQSAPEQLGMTPLVELEAVNAFGLRLFRNEWTHVNMRNAERDFAADTRSGLFQLMALPDGAFGHAKALALSLTPSIGVRSADVLHVAAAIELGASALYTFDQRQHRTAVAAGLKVNALP